VRPPGLVGRPQGLGWLQWPQKTDIVHMYFGEYSNTDDGVGVSGRVNSPSFHVITDVAEANNFTVKNLYYLIKRKAVSVSHFQFPILPIDKIPNYPPLPLIS
jgi:hypothetical protein